MVSQNTGQTRDPVSAVEWIICPHADFLGFFKGWNKQRRPPFYVFHSTGRSFTYLFSLIRRKDIWPWFYTHTLFFKNQFSLLLCFVYQGSWLSFFLLSLLPGQSQNIEYLERKKGKLANRLSISFVAFRDYYFSLGPPKKVLFEVIKGEKESMCACAWDLRQSADPAVSPGVLLTSSAMSDLLGMLFHLSL